MIKFFSRKTDPSERAAAPEDPPRPARAEATDAPIKAENILAKRQEPFGKLYLISLEDIFAILGERSSRMDDAVRLICKRAIERHLGSVDTVEIEREDVYIFRFPEADDAQGWAKAKAIVDEVGGNVLGERYVRSEEKPMIRLAVVAAQAVQGDDGDLDGAAIVNALDQVRGETREETLLNWQRFVVRKKEDDAGDWVEFYGAKHQSGVDKAWDGIKDACQKAFLKRKASERRKSRLPFKDVDRRRSFDRRGRGY